MPKAKLRPKDITDHINDSLNRLKETIGVLSYIYEKEKIAKEHGAFLLSMADVYSRDAVNVLSNLLDQDDQTSSLFTLCGLLPSEKQRLHYHAKILKIKATTKEVLTARYNRVGHFNTAHNTIEKDSWPVNTPIMVDPDYLVKRVKLIEELFWDLKEKLKIDGVLIIVLGAGSVVDSLKLLFDGKQPHRTGIKRRKPSR
ncbi:hypothetical protein KBC55_01760 [Patescibacteria group bacterium]|nr:hypothetical protein [Patescibacteria group bacterium]